jgi:hypothetical protein
MKTNFELPRIWRWAYADFGHDLEESHYETVQANAVYTDAILAEIAANGFNTIWVHAILHHVVPSRVFPEFGQRAALHLENMRALIARAGRHNLQVYLYLQPPRGFDARDGFWKNHPQVQGAPMPWETIAGEHTTFCALCTSTPQVKEYLRDSSAAIGRELPDLGGLILVTATEYPSHCYRSYQAYGEPDFQSVEITPQRGCTRCIERPPADVVTEIITLVNDGLHSTNADAKVIALNWSWNTLEADPSPNIIGGLPSDVILGIDFERGDEKEILGKVRPIDEYAMSFPGPSKRFLGTYKIAKKRDLQVLAKFQVSTTHELATVPSLLLLGNLYERAWQMRKLKVRGFFACWSFGNMLSANTSAFNEFFNAKKLPSRATALREFATHYFGENCDAETTRQAWEIFGEAMNNFPFSIPFLYMAPTNYALGYPLKPGALTRKTAGRSWVADKRGDDLSACLNAPYTLDEIIRGFGLLSRQWKKGAQLFERALKDCEGQRTREEVANAWVCHHSFRSTHNVFHVYKLRKNWTNEKMPAYQKIIRDELENVQAALPFVEADRRFGYHTEAHAYLYDAPRLKTKIRSLKNQLA